MAGGAVLMTIAVTRTTVSRSADTVSTIEIRVECRARDAEVSNMISTAHLSLRDAP